MDFSAACEQGRIALKTLMLEKLVEGIKDGQAKKFLQFIPFP